MWLSALEGPNAAADFAKTAFFVLIAFNFFLFFLSKKPVDKTVEFDEEGITIGRKKYIYSEIERLGYGAGEEVTFIGSTDAVLSHMAVQGMFGTSLWMQYGSKYVTIFSGLKREDAEGILRRIEPVFKNP